MIKYGSDLEELLYRNIQETAGDEGVSRVAGVSRLKMWRLWNHYMWM